VYTMFESIAILLTKLANTFSHVAGRLYNAADNLAEHAANLAVTPIVDSVELLEGWNSPTNEPTSEGLGFAPAPVDDFDLEAMLKEAAIDEEIRSNAYLDSSVDEKYTPKSTNDDLAIAPREIEEIRAIALRINSVELGEELLQAMSDSNKAWKAWNATQAQENRAAYDAAVDTEDKIRDQFVCSWDTTEPMKPTAQMTAEEANQIFSEAKAVAGFSAC
jgi:hypothetical protein